MQATRKEGSSSMSLPGRNTGHRTPIYDGKTGRVIAHDVRMPDGSMRREAVAGTALQRQIDAACECAKAEAAYDTEQE
jgi:hypothetical protein